LLLWKTVSIKNNSGIGVISPDRSSSMKYDKEEMSVLEAYRSGKMKLSLSNINFRYNSPLYRRRINIKNRFIA
jgi:hypothetical protein